MKIVMRALICVTIATSLLPSFALAFGLGGATREKSEGIDELFLQERNRTAAPFAHVMFCYKSPTECASSSEPGVVQLTAAKQRELQTVNRSVNRLIRPMNDRGSDQWQVAPTAGDCEDYALTKRHMLIKAGWPASALRLAVAHTAWGEGHMVLVVRTSKGDLVLDNLTSSVRHWRKTGLRWEMIQSSSDPRNWFRV